MVASGITSVISGGGLGAVSGGSVGTVGMTSVISGGGLGAISVGICGMTSVISGGGLETGGRVRGVEGVVGGSVGSVRKGNRKRSSGKGNRKGKI